MSKILPIVLATILHSFAVSIEACDFSEPETLTEDCAMALFPDPVTDPKRYEEDYSNLLRQSEIWAHFPASIPDGAQDPTFYFLPQIMQGAGIAFLSFELETEEIAEIMASFEDVALKIYNIAESDYRELKRHNRASRFYLATDFPEPPPPNPPEVLNLKRNRQNIVVIYLKAENTSDLDWWNHGYTAGVYVQNNNRVSFWAKSW